MKRKGTCTMARGGPVRMTKGTKSTKRTKLTPYGGGKTVRKNRKV